MLVQGLLDIVLLALCFCLGNDVPYELFDACVDVLLAARHGRIFARLADTVTEIVNWSEEDAEHRNRRSRPSTAVGAV